MDKIKILNRIKSLHPHLISVEIKSSMDVKVRDEYGECKVQLHSLLSGSKPTIASAINKSEYFSNKLKKVQPNIILLSEYKGSNSKVKVRTKHGDCLCIASALLKGKPISIDVAINKTDYYISRAKEIHKNRYDYSKTHYTDGNSKVVITCKKHGNFEQDASAHLKGKGCIKCSYEDKSGGWYNNHRNLKKSANMYVLKFRGNEEEFLKFGITTDLNKRINAILNACDHAYKITIVKVIMSTAEHCMKLESRYRKIIDITPNKYIKYEPKIPFQGKHECFKIIQNS